MGEIRWDGLVGYSKRPSQCLPTDALVHYLGVTVSEEYGGINAGYLQHTIAIEGKLLHDFYGP
jgi:hypothetical protein